jgi:hypothetical protein
MRKEVEMQRKKRNILESENNICYNAETVYIRRRAAKMRFKLSCREL